MAKKTDAKKEKKSGKVGIFKRIGNFFRGIIGEIKKIVWPTPQATLKNTIVVIVACLLIGACVWIFDFGMGKFVDWVLGFAGKK